MRFVHNRHLSLLAEYKTEALTSDGQIFIICYLPHNSATVNPSSYIISKHRNVSHNILISNTNALNL